MRQALLTLVTLLTLHFTPTWADAEQQQLVGVNISGAELNSNKPLGRNGFDYIWPSVSEINRFADAGFTVIRVPFTWARMQPELNGPLDSKEVALLDTVINAAKAKNVAIVIDPHDYGQYKGKVIGSPEVSAANFQDFWNKLAARYKDARNVIFGLMNEPFKQTSTEWASIAQAGIDGIRSAGATQLILVPGNAWTGAHSWFNRLNYGASPSNAEALINIHDPQNNYAYEMHQYFDSDSSGTHPTCVSADIGTQRLQKATQWLKDNGKRGFLGEFGASKDPTCLQALEDTLQYLKQNKNVWAGWTYWAAGKWWGKYMFNIQSLNAETTPQYAIIKNYLTH